MLALASAPLHAHAALFPAEQVRHCAHRGHVRGYFDAPKHYTLGTESDPLGLVAADVDGDGHVDLAATASAQGQVRVLLNKH